MRYIVVEEQRTSKDLIAQNECVFKIKDTKTDRVGLGMYKSRETAERIVEAKNVQVDQT